MERLLRFFRRHSRAINIVVNVLLMILCGVGYALLLILYSTQGMGIESFKYVGRGSLAPTTAIPLLGVLLTGATSALLTRSVEHSIWIRLLCGKTELLPTKRFPTEEFHHRAQWSVSPFARLLYVFRGRSWLLRISGLLLLGTAILNPILLYGVRPQIVSDNTTTTIPQSQPNFSGFAPLYAEEMPEDHQMMVASLVAMNNLSAPAAAVCADSSCTATTRANALQAECLAFDLPASAQNSNYTLCSSSGNVTCVSKPYDGVNFTTGPVTRCDNAARAMECLSSDFAVVLGLWSSYNSDTRESTGHALDCKIHRGSVEIRQTGTGTPVITRDSFTKSATPMEIPSNEYFWQQAYASYSGFTVNSFRFSYQDPMTANNVMAEYLLGNARTSDGEGEDYYALQLGTNDTERVARAMEANMEMATLFAFAQSPHAASLDITTTLEDNIWTYDSTVLAILALPLLATVLVLCIGWKVQSDEVVIGYDPLGIARRADEVLIPSLRAMTQGASEGKNRISSTSSGAYSALEARPPSPAAGAGEGADLVGDFAGTSPPRRFHSTDTDVRRDGLTALPLHHDEYEGNQNARDVIFGQGHPPIREEVVGERSA